MDQNSNSDSAENWVLLMAYGRDFVGVLHRAESGRSYLEPAYLYSAGIQVGPQGAQLQRQCAPIALLASQRRLPVPPESHVIPFSSMSADEQKQIRNAVRIGEEMAAAMRRAESGLVVVGPGALPPKL